MEPSKNTLKQNALMRLKAQQDKLQARIQLLEARHKTSERKNDTHHKILVSSYYLDQAKEQGNLDEFNSHPVTVMEINL